MAEKYLRIGPFENLVYDDTDFPNGAIETNAHISCAEPPSDPTHVLRMADIGAVVWPVGSIFLSADSANPATKLGFGSWVRIAEGQFLVGQKDGDSDFGTAGTSGGSKTHTHNVDPASFSSGVPSDTTEVASGSGASVASSSHTHSIDVPNTTSSVNSSLPPYFVVYMWQRTA